MKSTKMKCPEDPEINWLHKVRPYSQKYCMWSIGKKVHAGKPKHKPVGGHIPHSVYNHFSKSVLALYMFQGLSENNGHVIT